MKDYWRWGNEKSHTKKYLDLIHPNEVTYKREKNKLNNII